MLADGFKLMVVGLCTVFVFLSFMILIISLIAKVLLPLIKTADSEQSPVVTQKGAVVGPLQEDKALAGVIMAAVYRYRADRKRK